MLAVRHAVSAFATLGPYCMPSGRDEHANLDAALHFQATVPCYVNEQLVTWRPMPIRHREKRR